MPATQFHAHKILAIRSVFDGFAECFPVWKLQVAFSDAFSYIFGVPDFALKIGILLINHTWSSRSLKEERQ